MSDLIININFNESNKKNNIVIETFEGIIPKLKSRKYSGQLRNVNINALSSYDNVDNMKLDQIQHILNKQPNIQISSNQYLIAAENLIGLTSIVTMGCLFYRDKRTSMFQITSLVFDSTMCKMFYSIDAVKFGGIKTKVYFIIDHLKVKQVLTNIQPKAYVDLSNKSYLLNLIFDYNNYLVDYQNKDRIIIDKSIYRDYGTEEKIVNSIQNCGWINKKSEGFIYTGKSIDNDLTRLINYGINVYTNTEKKISKADFSNIRVSYNIDWFNINGKVNIDGMEIALSDLLQLNKERKNWVEYKNQVVFIPDVLNSKHIITNSINNDLRIDKKYVINAMEVANDINGSSIINIDKLFGYNDITLIIDDKLNNILRPYQKVGVKWLLSLKKNGFGGCLADDMGLGKTIQIIAYLTDKSVKNDHNLVVAPKTLIVNWKREIKKFAPEISLYVYHGIERDYNQIKCNKVIISTYQTIVNDMDLFKNTHFDNLIIDEAQYVKNSNSKAYNALVQISASEKIILTGTPIENNLDEFCGLMKLINPDIMKSYKKGVTKDNIDNVKLFTSPFLLRRLKKDVLKDLPEKQEQTLTVKMDILQQQLYDRMLNSIKYEILKKNDRYEIKSNSIMLNGLLYLQEICCHPLLLNREYNKDGCYESAKLDLLMELLISLYENGHKVVIFSRFTRMLQIIQKRIVVEHMNYFYLDGKTKDRMAIIDEFEKCNQAVFLVSLKAGGTGINLTSADTAIIYDPWWNPSSERQAEDRIYRIGQKKNVMIYRLITEGTIEEKIQNLQLEKLELSSKILDGHEVPINLTADVMRHLIMG